LSRASRVFALCLGNCKTRLNRAFVVQFMLQKQTICRLLDSGKKSLLTPREY
jgi:hypothetical protein